MPNLICRCDVVEEEGRIEIIFPQHVWMLISAQPPMLPQVVRAEAKAYI